MFTPALPSDVLVNVYINLNKLCLTVYQLHALQPNSTKVSRTLPTPSPQHLRPLTHALQPQRPETGSDALLPRTSAQLEALCSTALEPCCKYTVGRGALEGPLHLRGCGTQGPHPLPTVSGAPSAWR